MSQNTTEVAEIKEAEKTGTVDMSTETTNSGNYSHKFRNPVKIGDKTYTELVFYFEELTGADIEAIEEELQDQNRYVLSPEISSAFQTILAAKAAKVSSEVIRNLPVPDYMRIKNKARDFLVSAGY